MPGGFDDLIAANRVFADEFDFGGFDGVAHAGVAIVTCMDSRIVPLLMLGLQPGDAKILRNPGGRVTPAALEALVLDLLGVERVLVIPHTRCAVALNNELRAPASGERVGGQGCDRTTVPCGCRPTKKSMEDVVRVRSHPLIPESVAVGGFIYDVDTGLIDQRF